MTVSNAVPSHPYGTIEHMFGTLRDMVASALRARHGERMVVAMSIEAGYDEAKFAELLLYVAERLKDDPEGGAVKLNKALWRADTACVRMHGRSITGASYQKLTHGPAPRRLVPVRNALLQRGDAVLKEDWYGGYRQHRLIPIRPADIAVLSEEERAIVDQVVGSIRGKSASQLSAESHNEMGWKMVDYGDTIPISSAYLADETPVTPAMREHARTLAERHGR